MCVPFYLSYSTCRSIKLHVYVCKGKGRKTETKHLLPNLNILFNLKINAHECPFVHYNYSHLFKTLMSNSNNKLGTQNFF